MRAPASEIGRFGRGGITIVEAVVATMIVAVMLVAALRTAAFSGVNQYKAAERVTGRFLADALTAEIIALNYQDPAGGGAIGLDSGESFSPRTALDDVDDYDGFSESPPKDRDGNLIPGLTGWQWSVSVQWVNPADLTATSSTETWAKRIVVTAKHNNAVVATRTAIRTQAP